MLKGTIRHHRNIRISQSHKYSQPSLRISTSTHNSHPGPNCPNLSLFPAIQNLLNPTTIPQILSRIPSIQFKFPPNPLGPDLAGRTSSLKFADLKTTEWKDRFAMTSRVQTLRRTSMEKRINPTETETV